jgi:hypothetical protein
VEQINPYAVVRNTATYEAYRAYNRAAWKAGQGLVMAGMVLPGLWVPLELLIGQRLGHTRGAEVPLLAVFLIAPTILSLACLIVGALKIAKFRREHPIPEEWRQIPRFTWPARRPLPPRGRGR